MDPHVLLIASLIFIVAMLYSSVGHGGASGYLAVLSFFAFLPDEMATTALLLNIIVASLAFRAFYRAGYFSWRLTWPFMAASIPAAFLGGYVAVPREFYFAVLALVLLYAAWRLSFHKNLINEDVVDFQPIPPGKTFPAGGVIGLLSGLIGVGGGIFLSPLMILKRWANTKQTAATSAMFIVANAIAGLLGRSLRNGLIIGTVWPFLLAGLLGGFIGSYWGAQKLSGSILRRVLAVVLLLAAFKLLLQLWVL